MNPLILALISGIVPALVSFAERMISREHPDAGEKKRQWVIDAVTAMVDKLEPHVPDFLKPELPELVKLIDQGIEAELTKWGIQ